MLKRAIIIAVVLATALFLQFLQNKVLVGEQELNAEVRTQENACETTPAFAVVFKDVAGNLVELNSNERGELLTRLKTRLAGNDRDSAIPVTDVAYEAAGRQFLLKADKGVDELALRQRVQGKPFHRPNEAKGFWNVNLGIDLRGGVEFICRLRNDEGKVVPADDEVVGTLRNRLDERGLTEPVVARLSNGDVQIVIPGGTRADGARTRKVLETTGRLEFREVLEDFPSKEFPGREPGAANCAWAPRPGGGFTFAPGVYHNRGDVLVPHQTEPGLPFTRFYRLAPAALTGKDVADAHETMQEGQRAVGIGFTSVGAGKNHEFTTAVKSRGDARTGTGRLAIVFDGVVVSDATVIQPSSQNCVISGRFSKEEVENLRTVLKSGSLAVTPEILSERVVGATLGMEEVSRALHTMFWTMATLVAFLGLYYRRLGVVAIFSVAVNAALTWSTLSVFQATLTLPGIAGLILSLAMGIDTNILIYERIREELREDKGLLHAIEAGYGRAFLTVLDSHLTTISAGFVLYVIGSGPIKGFGLTLMIGIAISLFSGVFVGRLLTDFLCRGKQTLNMSFWFKPIHLGFVSIRRFSYALVITTAIIGISYFAFGHKLHPGQTFERNFDIEFTGGTMVQVSFREPVDLARVDASIAKAWEAVPADKHEGSLINPREIQKQPYFPNLAQAGGASRQWVFRVRDEQGAALERERHELEQQRVAVVKRIAALRDGQPADPLGAKRVEKDELAPLSEQVAALAIRISDRTDEFKRQLSGAFAGLVDAEGDEVLAATWADNRLSMRVATLEPVNEAQTNEMTRRLAHLGHQVTVKSLADGGKGLEIVVGFSERPKPQPGAAEAAERDKVAQRCIALLGQGGLTPADAKDLGAVAGGVYEALADAAANQKIAVAQPFPASQHFSGQVADRMKFQALLALSIALIAMMLYIAARFEMAFGLGAVISLLHVVIQTLGVVALIGIRIDLTIIAAFLTIVGYAINDTIVLYDRIRENLGKMVGKPLEAVLDMSIAEVMPRTILTGGHVALALAIMLVFAGDSLRGFCATLLIGILLGTYSSVFVAAPLLLTFKKRMLIPTPAAPAEGQGPSKP